MAYDLDLSQIDIRMCQGHAGQQHSSAKQALKSMAGASLGCAGGADLQAAQAVALGGGEGGGDARQQHRQDLRQVRPRKVLARGADEGQDLVGSLLHCLIALLHMPPPPQSIPSLHTSFTGDVYQ